MVETADTDGQLVPGLQQVGGQRCSGERFTVLQVLPISQLLWSGASGEPEREEYSENSLFHVCSCLFLNIGCKGSIFF